MEVSLAGLHRVMVGIHVGNNLNLTKVKTTTMMTNKLPLLMIQLITPVTYGVMNTCLFKLGLNSMLFRESKFRHFQHLFSIL